MFRDNRRQEFSALVFDLCTEMLERATDLECLLSEEYFRTKVGAFSPREQEPDKQKDATKKRIEQQRLYYEEKRILLRFQNELLKTELRLDATLDKLRLLFGDHEPEALYGLRFRGYFSNSIDAVARDISEIDGPEATEASRDLGRNYMIKEEKYPFGPIFTAAEILEFSKTVWQAMHNVYRGSVK